MDDGWFTLDIRSDNKKKEFVFFFGSSNETKKGTIKTYNNIYR